MKGVRAVKNRFDTFFIERVFEVSCDCPSFWRLVIFSTGLCKAKACSSRRLGLVTQKALPVLWRIFQAVPKPACVVWTEHLQHTSPVEIFCSILLAGWKQGWDWASVWRWEKAPATTMMEGTIQDHWQLRKWEGEETPKETQTASSLWPWDATSRTTTCVTTA